MDALTCEKIDTGFSQAGLIPHSHAKRVVSDNINVDPGAANNSHQNPSATSRDSVYLRIADPI